MSRSWFYKQWDRRKTIRDKDQFEHVGDNLPFMIKPERSVPYDVMEPTAYVILEAIKSGRKYKSVDMYTAGMHVIIIDGQLNNGSYRYKIGYKPNWWSGPEILKVSYAGGYNIKDEDEMVQGPWYSISVYHTHTKWSRLVSRFF